MKYVVDSESLTAIADAIREKTGKTESLTLDEMPTEVASIKTGGGGSTGVSKMALFVSGQPFTLTAEDLDGANLIKADLFYEAILTEVTVPSSVKTIEDYAFSYNETLRKVTIHEGLESLRNSAFGYCPSLEEVSLPSSLRDVAPYVFSGCTSLSKVTLADGLTTIGDHMFDRCSALEEIYFPKSITRINSGAFSSCTGMKLYDFTQHTTIPTLENSNAFSAIPTTCRIKVPPALHIQWIASTNWSALTSKIVVG
jgi:hypothetical protein